MTKLDGSADHGLVTDERGDVTVIVHDLDTYKVGGLRIYEAEVK